MPFNKITVTGSVVDNRYVYKVYKRAYSTTSLHEENFLWRKPLIHNNYYSYLEHFVRLNSLLTNAIVGF